MRSIFILAIIIIAATVITGCTQKSASPVIYNMKAGVDTIAYNVSNCIAISKSGTLLIEGISGSGSKPTFPYISIVIAAWGNTAGVSYFDNTMTGSYAQYLINDTAAELSQTGSVAIYSVSNVSVKGTFYFTCTNGAVISNGSFIAALQ